MNSVSFFVQPADDNIYDINSDDNGDDLIIINGEHSQLPELEAEPGELISEEIQNVDLEVAVDLYEGADNGCCLDLGGRCFLWGCSGMGWKEFVSILLALAALTVTLFATFRSVAGNNYASDVALVICLLVFVYAQSVFIRDYC